MKLDSREPAAHQCVTLTRCGAADAENTKVLAHEGWTFFLSAEKADRSAFRPTAQYRTALTGELKMLPVETCMWPTVEEALLHAERAAIRWFRDRLGDGRGHN